MQFLSEVKFYNKELIYPDTNCAYKIINNDIYYVDLCNAVCGVDNDENYTLGHDWWNKRSHLFDWQKVTDWSLHKPKKKLASTWADKYIIINLLKKITQKTTFFNNE